MALDTEIPRIEPAGTSDVIPILPIAKPHKVIKRRQKLAEIEGSLEHKLALQDWNAQLSASFNSLDRKLSSRNSCTSEIYQILGLFFVFHGIILTAVAQASAIKCRHSWLIFTLSAMVSVPTMFGCIQKLKEIAEAERNYFQEKALCAALFQSIQQLKEKGVAFDLEKGQPNSVTKLIDRGQIRAFVKRWTLLIYLLVFAGVNLAAINLIVCDLERNV